MACCCRWKEVDTPMVGRETPGVAATYRERLVDGSHVGLVHVGGDEAHGVCRGGGHHGCRQRDRPSSCRLVPDLLHGVNLPRRMRFNDSAA